MKFIKQLFRDLIDLPRYEFARKYILLPAVLFFLWVAIGNIIELNLSKDMLLHVKGSITSVQLVTTKIVDKPFYKNIEQDMWVFINERSEGFRIENNYKPKSLLTQINVGDTVDIYYRNTFMTILGMGKQSDIYQLENKNVILFSLYQRKSNSFGLSIIATITTIGFGLYYFHWRSKRKSFINAA